MFRKSNKSSLVKFLTIFSVSLGLAGCNAMTRMSEVGSGPRLSKIEDPQAAPDYTPVSMPMPKAQPTARNPNSLWRSGARSFFKDQRASQVGDLLTVNVELADKASMNDNTTRRRVTGEIVTMPNMFGVEGVGLGAAESALAHEFSGHVAGAPLVSTASVSGSVGTGQIARDEKIKVEVAAIIMQVLPNGNFVVHGRQEFKVNHELRELVLDGIVRPEDIRHDNTINHNRIAEARISYGGRGTISEVQQPRWGQQFFDIIAPW